MLVREAMRPVAIGIAVGIAGAFGLTRALSSMLFGISSTDAMTYVVACSVLARRGAGGVNRAGQARAPRRSDHRGARGLTETCFIVYGLRKPCESATGSLRKPSKIEAGSFAE